ncbi:MAG: polysaccharide biosynthesis tyrosine autokinase, partial [Candidatus Aminicenantes bacterium]|nr:polysaccharide biosynthesis tyrosine autokinase [Candidatus Aminicenantes bacterium]
MTTQTDKREVDLLDIVRIAFKRKWIIFLLSSVFMLIVLFSSLTKTPEYRATVRIMIEESTSGVTNLDDVLDPRGQYSENRLGTYFNTQLTLLRSRTLAERVALKMDLASRPEVQLVPEASFKPFRIIKDLFTLRFLRPKKAEVDPDQSENIIPLEDQATPMAYTVLDGLEVFPIIETRLVDISHTSYNPVLSADIVNHLTTEFINYTVEMRYAPTQQATEFLQGQIAQIKREIDAKERELQRYSTEKGIVVNEDSGSALSQNYERFSEEFMNARLDKISKETKYRELQKMDVDTIPPYYEDKAIGDLRSQYFSVQSEYTAKSGTYKPDYPQMKELVSRMNSLKSTLRTELAKARDTAYQDYQDALSKEERMKNELQNSLDEVQNSGSTAIYAQSLQSDITNKRSLLNNLDQRLNESMATARLKGFATSNIKIIDPALVPPDPLPKNTIRNLILALMLGVFLGAGIAFLAEYLDNTIRDPEEIEKALNIPSLGIIPFVSANGMGKKAAYRSGYGNYTYGQEGVEEDIPIEETRDVELINHLFPNLAIAEDYRTVRTSILFSHAGKPPKIITFTSSFPQEGKSSTVANLAVSFSQLGKRVLLIDADLRRPRLHKIFKASNIRGLSNYLTGKIMVEEAVQMTAIKNMWLIPSGPNPPNPAELLDSDTMKELAAWAAENYDIVLIDSPPALAVIDPVVLSQVSDSTVIVVRPGKTSKKALIKTIAEIRKSTAQIIGIIYNEVKVKSNGNASMSPSYQSYMT